MSTFTVRLRENLEQAGVVFTEHQTMANDFWGTRFQFKRNQIKKVESVIKSMPGFLQIRAYFKEWCIEVF